MHPDRRLLNFFLGAGTEGVVRVEKKLTQAEWVIVVAGAVAFLASFLPWEDAHGFSVNAWDEFAFPTYTWVGIFGLVMAGTILLRTFTSVSLPSNVLGFTWLQIDFILAIFVALIAASFLIAGDYFGFGFWLSLLAAIALVVGAVMLRNESTTSSI